MTRKEIVGHMESVFSKGLYAGMIVFRSPIDGTLDERHIYADSNFEIVDWLDRWEKFYKDKDIQFVSYLNNIARETYKFQITEEDCKDE